jgi:hypothetical protein
MRWIKTVADELLGLFVDDARFAVAILVWLLLVWLAVSRLGLSPRWAGIGLCVGLAAILVESAVRRGRR